MKKQEEEERKTSVGSDYVMSVIKENRVKNNISQRQIASSIGITRAFYTQLETGEVYCHKQVITDICKFLKIKDVSIEYEIVKLKNKIKKLEEEIIILHTELLGRELNERNI